MKKLGKLLVVLLIMVFVLYSPSSHAIEVEEADSFLLEDYEEKSNVEEEPIVEEPIEEEPIEEEPIVDYASEEELLQLQELLSKARAYDQSKYTDDTAAILADAISLAEDLLVKENPTSQEVEDLLKELEDAIAGLVEKPVAPTIIAKDVSLDVGDDLDLTSLFTARDKDGKELEVTIKGHVDINTVGVYEVLGVASIDGLEASAKASVNVVENDKQALGEIITLADLYGESRYTKESFEKFSLALDTAKAVYEDVNATKNEISDARDNLLASIEALEIKKLGWTQVDGKWTYYKNDGSMAKSEWVWAPVLGGDSNYNWKFFNYKGENINQFYNENNDIWISTVGPNNDYVKGWWTNPDNGYEYYFRETSGSRVDGWQKIENGWHFFRENSGTRALDYQYIDGDWYYLEEPGRATSKWVWSEVNVDGSKKHNWKFFNYQGKNIEQFYKENGKTWLSQKGPLAEYARGWKNINGLQYYFRETSGSRVSGWQYIDGGKYYFRPQGTAVSGLQYIDGKQYIFNENASRPYLNVNTVLSHKGYLYEIDRNGVANRLAAQRWSYENNRFRRYSNGVLVDDRIVGNRFIVVDLKTQKMYMYKDGKSFVETNVVTGKPSTPTITGTFKVYAKQRNRYLQNEWFVNYWIPFEGGYGIHDASWQTNAAYNDVNAYKYRGSQGCVNTPLNNVKKIYENIRVGDTVVVFE